MYVDAEVIKLQDQIDQLKQEVLELKEINRLLGKQITIIKTQNEEIITDINIFKEGGNL
jgi:TolA-binding protein